MTARPVAVGLAAFLKVRKLLDEASNVAFAEVERRARHALRTHPSYGFCMAMGSASFFRHDRRSEDVRAWQAATLNFVDEYDRELKLTGMPMKIESADGPLITNW